MAVQTIEEPGAATLEAPARAPVTRTVRTYRLVLRAGKNGRVHAIVPGTTKPVGNGLYEAITVCGERIVGRPALASGGATCPPCVAGRSH